MKYLYSLKFGAKFINHSCRYFSCVTKLLGDYNECLHLTTHKCCKYIKSKKGKQNRTESNRIVIDTSRSSHRKRETTPSSPAQPTYPRLLSRSVRGRERVRGRRRRSAGSVVLPCRPVHLGRGRLSVSAVHGRVDRVDRRPPPAAGKGVEGKRDK